jgi:hypothetical protein
MPFFPLEFRALKEVTDMGKLAVTAAMAARLADAPALLLRVVGGAR